MFQSDTSKEPAHRSRWRTFEVVFGIPFLAAVILQLVKPLALPAAFLTPAIVPVGVALIVVGLALIVLARREFARRGQPTDPGRPTTRLVTTGVFSISRNPLYLGGVCVLIGIALTLGLTWVFVFLLPALVAGHYILIVPEERYLATNFDGAYERYAASVHRWFGNARPTRQQRTDE